MIGQRLLERYRIEAEVGRGGMGVVYRAIDSTLDRAVAVKMISSRVADEVDMERFEREARLVARLDHPGIVPIYDFGRHEEHPFFVMPLVEGKTLHGLLAEGGLSLRDAVEIVAQVAEVLDYSAGCGVVHRDIKPENLMVEELGDRLRVRVMDFGLAITRQRARITAVDQLPGTLAYLAPEHILSLDVDGRSDLYSLGVILYECLAGDPPFTGGSHGSVLYRIVHEAPRPLTVLAYDPALDRIVQHCLAKEPEDRPARGQDLASALRRYLETIAATEQLERAMPSPAPSARTPSTPLFGRVEEMARIEKGLDAAFGGECHLVLLGGEAGLGKSRLLRELEELARKRGAWVLRGRFAGQETFPYHGFCELIQDFYRIRDSTLGGDAVLDLGDLAPELVALFPALGEIPGLSGQTQLPPAPPVDPEHDRVRIFELIARTLGRLAEGRPMVLLLEHLHAADVSIAALEYLVRRLGSTPTLVVGTWRPEGLGRNHPLRRLFETFEGDPRCSMFELSPLSPEGHRRLLAHLLRDDDGERHLGREVVRRLYEATEGNPLFTRELVKNLRETGDLVLEEGRTWGLVGAAAVGIETLPETVQQVVEARIERLEERVLRVLGAASVLGRNFEAEDLLALVGDEDLLEDALERLLAEGLLEEDRRSREVRFKSGVVREVLHGRLPRRRRRLLHRRYANYLEQRYEKRLERVYPQLVYHFSEGDEAIKTVTYALMLARRAAGAFSPSDTQRAARIALEFMEDYELEGSEVEGELRHLLAEALRLQGQLSPALREAGKACESLAAAGEDGAAAGAARLAAELAWQLRRVDDARRHLARGIELARRAGTPRRLQRLLVLAATVANLRGEHRRAQEFLQQVAELEEVAGVGERRGGILRTTLSDPPTTLDPVHAFTVEDAEVLSTIFETLLITDADGHLVPGAARGWHTPDGGSTFLLELHHDHRFSDGEPLTAIVARSCLLASRERSGQALPAALGALVGDGKAAIEVAGEHTLRFRLECPLPIFPALLTDPRTGLARAGGEEGRFLGTGPFRLASGGGDRLRLEANPYAARPKPHIEGVELRILRDPSEIAAELRAGQLDLGGDLPPDALDDLLQDASLGAQILEAPRTNLYFACFNVRAGASARHLEIRRRLFGAVRLEELVWRVLGRFARPAHGVIPPGLLGHDPARRRPMPELPQESERWSAEKPLELRVRVHPVLWERYGRFLEELFAAWGRVGVVVRVESTGMESLMAALEEPGDLDLVFSRWMPDYYDPDNVTRSMLHSQHGLYRHFRAAQGAEQDVLDDLLDQARLSAEPAERIALYRRFEDRLAESYTVLPLFHDIDYRVALPRVRGLRHLNRPPYLGYRDLSLEDRPETGGDSAKGRRTESSAFGAAPPIRVPVVSQFDALEPVLTLFVEPAQVLPNLFETLTTVEEGARVAPHLAESVELEDGHRRVVVRLRRGVLFHDGRPLTSADVRYSFERLLHRRPYPGVETALAPIRGALELIRGATDRLVGLEERGEHELAIELVEPMPSFPSMLTNPMTAIVPAGGGAAEGTGTGPYRLRRWVPGQFLELQPNPDYWAGDRSDRPRLIFELGVPVDELADGLESGRFALSSNLRPMDVERLRQDPRFAASFREAPAFCTYFLVPNAHRGPFTDRAVRQAFGRALGADSLVHRTLGGLGLPAAGLVSPGLPGYEPPMPQRDHNETFPTELLGAKLKVLLHPAYGSQYPYVWERLERRLLEGGLKLESLTGSMSEILGHLDKGGPDLAAARRLAAFPDPDAFANVFHSQGGLFGRLVGNAGLDEWIEAGRREADPDRRHGIYRQLEDYLREEALIFPLFDEQICCLAQPELTGLRLRLAWPRIAFDELSWR